MQARAGDDRIRHAVAERDRLGRPLHPFEPEPTKHREHPRIRLDRDHTGPSEAIDRVSFPVPAPSSTTSSAPSGTSQRAAFSGHSGRARS